MNANATTQPASGPHTATNPADAPTAAPASPQVMANAAGLLGNVANEMTRSLRGKPEIIETALICVLAEGHLLLDDVPGVGKTVLAKALAATIGGRVSRVQFTPDLLPGDITGVSIWQPTKESFAFRPGPIFANLVLCDELNRGPAKTQAALLEAMEERCVTIDGTTYPLERPFMVIATQNPFEQDGTYNLPESQIDRFLMRTAVGYPDRNAELEMLTSGGADNTVSTLREIASVRDVAGLTALTAAVYTAPPLLSYVADIVRGTREHADAALGASPRGGLALARASKGLAVLRGRAYVTPDDVRAVAHRVLDHRVLVRGTSRWNRERSAAIVDAVLHAVPVPTGRSTGP